MLVELIDSIYVYQAEWEPAKNVLKKWKSIIDFFVSPNVVLHDGNGRTGRMILFRECLYHGIAPFIIEDANRPEYLDALKFYHQGKERDSIVFIISKRTGILLESLSYFLAE